jgi:cytoskeletal protein RodZ
MPFAVICKSCQARFLLNDDLLRRKVAGRVVTVRCRQCHAPIEVDASQVDAELAAAAAPKPEPPGPPPAPPLKAALNYKPAPSPPRPAKSSTLIGIGVARPASVGEMVALSPGFLNMSAPAAAPGPRGFPEPPPPPSSLEDISGDWEIPEAITPVTTPVATPVESAPESVDDFIEELPPSLPPPVEEEQPSSLGTPSLSALTHHLIAPKPRGDDFFATTSGGAGPLEMVAPTIDVSSLETPNTPTPLQQAASIDISSFDLPRSGKQTLPLFGLNETAPTLSPPTADSWAAPPKPRAASSAVDGPASSHRSDSPRSRRNVVAPEAKSDPPPAPKPRRSVVALPVLLVLAAAAGFLIWKRSAVPVETTARVEPSSPAPTAETPAVAPDPTPPAVAAATTMTAEGDDVTFETTPQRPASKAVAEQKPLAPPSTQSTEAPVLQPKKVETPTEPPPPAPKEDPKPASPSEPSGPFDRAAAAAALTASASAASACRKEGDPSGTASVVITFAPSGRVTSANIGGPPFAGTPTGGCIAAALRKTRVPPFEGERVTVSKTIVVQ